MRSEIKSMKEVVRFFGTKSYLSLMPARGVRNFGTFCNVSAMPTVDHVVNERRDFLNLCPLLVCTETVSCPARENASHGRAAVRHGVDCGH